MAAPSHDDASSSLIGRFHHTSLVGSTVPANGDLNPYGIVVVQRTEGRLVRGDVLVSNFNGSKNLQGTGSTIVEISPSGRRTLFAHITPASLPGRCPGGVGLTTGLVIINGWVIVGSLPSVNGTVAASSGGCLFVLDSNGTVRTIFRGHGIRGPWDATAVSHGRSASLFVANVLNGTKAAKGMVVNRGTILRLNLWFGAGQLPAIKSVTKIGSGFAEQSNATAFVLGPTGLGLGPNGALYVAQTGTNQVSWIGNAMTRTTWRAPARCSPRAAG
ncbi:MAG TPA: hypothetical protein VLX31_04525 [Streptosporangiaceae bacterium]|nr:hypothetical protein [Streptosporangiaceae bacterium]